MLSTHILKPPYDSFLSASAQQIFNPDPPVGTVVYGESTHLLEAVTWLAEVVTRLPWVIPVVGTCERSPATNVLSLTEHIPALRKRLGVACPTGTSPIQPASAIAAVWNRPHPTSLDLMAFVIRRTDCGKHCDCIREQFCSGLEPHRPPPRSKATYSMALACLGPYSAHDWRTIARLANRIVEAQAGGRGAPRGAGARIDLRPAEDRTLNVHCRKYLGRSRRAALRLAGWESVLELALRVGGYASP